MNNSNVKLRDLDDLKQLAIEENNQAIAEKYGSGCPGCTKLTCICPDEQKP